MNKIKSPKLNIQKLLKIAKKLRDYDESKPTQSLNTQSAKDIDVIPTQSKELEWEKEFDKRFVHQDKEFGQYYTGGTPMLIKQFIKDLLSSTRQQVQEEMVDKVEKMTSDIAYLDRHYVNKQRAISLLKETTK
jgi:hypothetical protein